MTNLSREYTFMAISKANPDQQLTGMAGEFLTAGKLFKRRFQVSITLGNAKGIDLFVYNPDIDRTFAVQVKSLRKKNCFPIKREDIKPTHVYVFVILNGSEQAEDYFILNGRTILENLNHFFGNSYTRQTPSNFPAINYGPLREYRDNWKVFDETENSAPV